MFPVGESGVEVIIIKSKNKRYFIRTNSKFRGFIVHTDNYKRDQKKIEIELIGDNTTPTQYRPIDQVIMFDSESEGTEKTVFLILSNPPGTGSQEKYIYFSEVRMNETLGTESEVVWWIYFVLGLVALLFMIVIFMMIMICISRSDEQVDETPSDNTDKPPSLSKSESEHFKTNESNPLPGPLRNDYIKGISVSRT